MATPPADPPAIFLDLQGPIDLAASLRPFGRWGDDGIDRWDGRTLLRTVRLDGVSHAIPYAVEIGGGTEQPRLCLRLPDGARGRESEIVAAVRATFVGWPRALERVSAADPRVRRLVELYRGVVPVLVPDPFTALVRSISAQQVNLRWAATVRRRLAERYGARHEIAGTFVYSLEPEPFADATPEELRAIQLTTAKSRSLIACARAAANGHLRPRELAAHGDEALVQRLVELPGIGRWSAEWFLARTLGRPRVVAGDLGVRKAVGRMYGVDPLPSEDHVRRLTQHWTDAATHIQALALFDLAESAAAA